MYLALLFIGKIKWNLPSDDVRTAKCVLINSSVTRLQE